MTTSTSSLIEKFTLGSIHVSVWINTNQAGVPYPSTRIERRYKDANGNYQTTNSYSRDALPVVINLVTRAQTLIKELEANPQGPFARPASPAERRAR